MPTTSYVEVSTIYTKPSVARVLVILAGAALVFGIWYGKDLKIGDLDAGAPELRADSRYNMDNKFIVENYTASTDVFVVMVQTADMQCVTYETYAAVDLFEWVMTDVPGVQSAISLIDASKRAIAGNNEGNPKWATVTRNQWVLNGSVSGKEMPPGLMNADCNLVPVMIFLEDHKAETLLTVTAAVEKFIEEYDTGDVRFRHGGRQFRYRSGDQRGRQQGPVQDAGLGVWRGQFPGTAGVPVDPGGSVHHSAAGPCLPYWARP